MTDQAVSVPTSGVPGGGWSLIVRVYVPWTGPLFRPLSTKGTFTTSWKLPFIGKLVSVLIGTLATWPSGEVRVIIRSSTIRASSVRLSVSPVMIWLAWLGIVRVEVVMSSGVPVPPPPLVGIGRGTFVEAIGPMTGCGGRVAVNESIGETIGLPAPSSGATR